MFSLSARMTLIFRDMKQMIQQNLHKKIPNPMPSMKLTFIYTIWRNLKQKYRPGLSRILVLARFDGEKYTTRLYIPVEATTHGDLIHLQSALK